MNTLNMDRFNRVLTINFVRDADDTPILLRQLNGKDKATCMNCEDCSECPDECWDEVNLLPEYVQFMAEQLNMVTRPHPQVQATIETLQSKLVTLGTGLSFLDGLLKTPPGPQPTMVPASIESLRLSAEILKEANQMCEALNKLNSRIDQDSSQAVTADLNAPELN
jgi:hypothetical protein